MLLGRLGVSRFLRLLARRGVGRGRRIGGRRRIGCGRGSRGGGRRAALAAATAAAAGRTVSAGGTVAAGRIATRGLGRRGGSRRGGCSLVFVVFVVFVLRELPDAIVLVRGSRSGREFLALGARKNGVHELLKDGQVGAVAQQVRTVLLDGNLACGITGPQGACQLRREAAEPQVGGVVSGARLAGIGLIDVQRAGGTRAAALHDAG